MPGGNGSGAVGRDTIVADREPTSSAADDGFAKVCKENANNNKDCKKSC